MRIQALAGAGLISLAITGCAGRGGETGMTVPGAAKAVAMLRTGAGADVGRASAMEVVGGLRFTVDGRGMPPGTHGAHVHMTGRCDAPGFETAGGHWNPTNAQHGTMNPRGPHEGDLPNLVVDSGGRGTIAVTIPGATMAGLMDADGAALIVHTGADDLMSDPAGNSGARIVCGVFQPS